MLLRLTLFEMPLNVSDSERQELFVTYAALILNDAKLSVSADNIQKLITAAGGTVEPYWPKLFGQNMPMCTNTNTYN